MSEYQPSDIRVSDSEREEALAKLGEHMSAGRLDIDEFGERSARVATAKTRGELLGLFGDLPEPKPVFGQPGPAGAAVAPRERTFAEKIGPVAVPVAAIVIVATLVIVTKLAFFVPLLIIFLVLNGRGRGGGFGGGYRGYDRRRDYYHRRMDMRHQRWTRHQRDY